MALLSVALATARTWLNDDVGATWTDAALIPKAQEAHRELQTKLWNVNSPVVRKEAAAATVNAGATTITNPADMLTPFRLQEYANTVETRADAIDMTECNFLPNRAALAILQDWCWKEEVIQFVAASADRKVIIYYRKLITIPVVAGDPIGILFGELYIGARAAAIAAGSVGNQEAFEFLSTTSESNFATVIAAQRGQQSPPSKP